MISKRLSYRLTFLLAAAICVCPAAARAQIGTGNTAYGGGALDDNDTGQYDTAIGESALQFNTTGSYNTALGWQAIRNNTTGDNNTGVGIQTLYANTSGFMNTATGYTALQHNTTGSYNTADGGDTLAGNTTGRYNTATGYHALASSTTGSYNTAGGSFALTMNNGAYNVAVGSNALRALTGDSDNNTAVGANAGRNTTAGDNNIYIANPGINGSESDVIRIGRTQTMTFIAGITRVPLSGATVVVKTNGQLGVVASSARYKQDVRSLDGASDKLGQLRPVSFRYTTEPKATHYGLIAEEVDKVLPELVVRDEEHRPESVQYSEIIPLLLQDRLEQQARIERQEAELARQRELIEMLHVRVDRLAELRGKMLRDQAALKD